MNDHAGQRSCQTSCKTYVEWAGLTMLKQHSAFLWQEWVEHSSEFKCCKLTILPQTPNANSIMALHTMIPEKCACYGQIHSERCHTPALWKNLFSLLKNSPGNTEHNWRYAQQCFVIGGNLARGTHTCNGIENNSQHTVLTLLGLHLLYLEMGLYEIAI